VAGIFIIEHLLSESEYRSATTVAVVVVTASDAVLMLWVLLISLTFRAGYAIAKYKLILCQIRLLIFYIIILISYSNVDNTDVVNNIQYS